KSTMARILQEIQPEEENHHGDHPSKLSSTKKCAIVKQILTGKATVTIFQATHFISSIISILVCSQIVRNTLSEASLKVMVKKRRPLALKYQHWTVDD
ncbi:hypothetical protein PAXRUDRAFT_151280, partial [Paxillus rubicundulus Ve08.2h10]